MRLLKLLRRFEMVPLRQIGDLRPDIYPDRFRSACTGRFKFMQVYCSPSVVPVAEIGPSRSRHLSWPKIGTRV